MNANACENRLKTHMEVFDGSLEQFFSHFSASCEFLAEIGQVDESFEGFDDLLKDLCLLHADWQVKFRKAKEFLEIVENCGDLKSLDKLLPLIEACKDEDLENSMGNEELSQNFAASSASDDSSWRGKRKTARKASRKNTTKKQKRSSEESALKSPYYSQLKAKIWDIHHPNESMHPDVDAASILDSDDESIDEDCDLIGGKGPRIVPLVCPITQIHLCEPMKNDGCNHTYSRDAISHLLQSNPICKCPVMGCNADVTRGSLKHDVDAQKKVDRILFMKQFKEASDGGAFFAASQHLQKSSGSIVAIEIN